MAAPSAWAKKLSTGGPSAASGGLSGRNSGQLDCEKDSDRLIFAFLALVGKKVRLEKKDSTIHEGVLTGSPISQHGGSLSGITLDMVRQLSPAGNDTVRREVKVDWKDVDNMIAVNCGLVDEILQANTGGRVPSPSGVRTDTDISSSGKGPGTERKLNSFFGSSGGAAKDGRLDMTDDGKKFDQFQVNREQFGVTSTYDENMYTTELDKSKLSEKDLRHAARIEREILGKSSQNPHVREERGQQVQVDFEDEEARYSSVMRSGTGYVPPHLRKASQGAAASASAASQQSSKQEKSETSKQPAGFSYAAMVKGPSGPTSEKGLDSVPKTAGAKASATSSTSNSKAGSEKADKEQVQKPVSGGGNESNKRAAEIAAMVQFSNSLESKTKTKPSTPSKKPERSSDTSSDAEATASAAAPVKTSKPMNAAAKEWKPNAAAAEFTPRGAQAATMSPMQQPHMQMMPQMLPGMPPNYMHHYYQPQAVMFQQGYPAMPGYPMPPQMMASQPRQMPPAPMLQPQLQQQQQQHQPPPQ